MAGRCPEGAVLGLAVGWVLVTVVGGVVGRVGRVGGDVARALGGVEVAA